MGGGAIAPRPPWLRYCFRGTLILSENRSELHKTKGISFQERRCIYFLLKLILTKARGVLHKQNKISYLVTNLILPQLSLVSPTPPQKKYFLPLEAVFVTTLLCRQRGKKGN